MRTVHVDKITESIREMCIEANYSLSPDMKEKLSEAEAREESPLGKQILCQLQENLRIAGEDQIPICQDTGMAVVFLEIGQEVHFEGGDLREAVNEGVRRGYTEGYLRKSVVGDPLIRENTKDNTPAVIHYEIVPGDQVKITVAPKGFGSENMSRIFMLKPADGAQGVKEAILSAVREAGPNACPPVVVGVGIGGTFEKAALMAKQALTRPVDQHSEISWVRDMEEELLKKINGLGIGPGGLGGKDHSPGCEHSDLRHAYRRTPGGSQYVLPCKPACGQDDLEGDYGKTYTGAPSGRRDPGSEGRRLCIHNRNSLHSQGRRP